MEESECKRFKADLEHCPDNNDHNNTTNDDQQPYPRLGEGHEQELTTLFEIGGSLVDSATCPSPLPVVVTGNVVVCEQRFVLSTFKHPSILRSVSDKLPHNSSHRKTHRRTNSSQSISSLGCHSSFDETAEGCFDNDIPEKTSSVPEHLNQSEP